MVRDVFRLAKENSPAIIFIDEIDAIATKRFDAQTGADREVQRILLELLNQMDGFDQSTNVKVSFSIQISLSTFLHKFFFLIGYNGHQPGRHSGSRPSASWSFGSED
jgi:SpoVK/Ycf46/Vps4 family AAA+-type ATPase